MDNRRNFLTKVAGSLALLHIPNISTAGLEPTVACRHDIFNRMIDICVSSINRKLETYNTSIDLEKSQFDGFFIDEIYYRCGRLGYYAFIAANNGLIYGSSVDFPMKQIGVYDTRELNKIMIAYANIGNEKLGISRRAKYHG